MTVIGLHCVADG